VQRNIGRYEARAARHEKPVKMLGDTHRIGLGTGANDLPQSNPLSFAQKWSDPGFKAKVV
jgi:hypothetical protein